MIQKVFSSWKLGWSTAPDVGVNRKSHSWSVTAEKLKKSACFTLLTLAVFVSCFWNRRGDKLQQSFRHWTSSFGLWENISCVCNLKFHSAMQTCTRKVSIQCCVHSCQTMRLVLYWKDVSRWCYEEDVMSKLKWRLHFFQGMRFLNHYSISHNFFGWSINRQSTVEIKQSRPIMRLWGTPIFYNIRRDVTWRSGDA